MIRILSSADPVEAHLQKHIYKLNLLTKEQFRFAQEMARQQNTHISQILLKDPLFKPDQMAEILSKYYEMPSVNLKERIISPYVLSLLPKQIAEEQNVVIFKKIQDEVHVATAMPHDLNVVEFIKKKTGLSPKIFITTYGDIQHAMKKYQNDLSEEFDRIIEEGTKQALAVHESQEKMAQFLPIIRMVDSLIERALHQNASDIHIESTADSVIIRYRIDGILQKIVTLPKEILPALLARIKIISQLKIDEHRLPQDGRLNFHYNDRDIAIRISSIPTLHGGKMVLRLLDTQKQTFTLRGLGFNENDLQIMKKEIKNQQGIILVTGPTGSGKTTTLYTLLRLLNKETQNICTIEDPIEYGLPGVNQTQINTQVGLTFARGLRSLLRQDPNILMVGEIRDRETAEIAFNAAMTGHLVLSTLHTNNAFLGPQRLIEMGVEPFLVASVTNLIMGQRLVRTICKHCKATVRSSPKTRSTYNQSMDLEKTYAKLQSMGLVPKTQKLEEIKFHYGRGCEKCGDTGFRGRIGIYEVVHVDETVSQAILRDQSATSVKKTATSKGTLTMKEDGILKVLQGITTFDELARVTQD